MKMANENNEKRTDGLKHVGRFQGGRGGHAGAVGKSESEFAAENSVQKLKNENQQSER
jgi:hypothetical protein